MTIDVTRNRNMPVSDTLRGKPSLPLIGLLLVEMIIGFEWLISGVAKFVRGGFPAGLAEELLAKSEGVPAWYLSLMQSAFIPNAQFFGYLVEITEVLAGVALIVGPLIWLFAWDRVSNRTRSSVLFINGCGPDRRDLSGDQSPPGQRRQPPVADPR